jgi:hypothetical protein
MTVPLPIVVVAALGAGLGSYLLAGRQHPASGAPREAGAEPFPDAPSTGPGSPTTGSQQPVVAGTAPGGGPPVRLPPLTRAREPSAEETAARAASLQVNAMRNAVGGEAGRLAREALRACKLDGVALELRVRYRVRASAGDLAADGPTVVDLLGGELACVQAALPATLRATAEPDQPFVDGFDGELHVVMIGKSTDRDLSGWQ